MTPSEQHRHPEEQYGPPDESSGTPRKPDWRLTRPLRTASGRARRMSHRAP